MKRLPLIPPPESRDGTVAKDGLCKNLLVEQDESLYATLRPALTSAISTSPGNGNGMVEFNGKLLSIYGANMNEYGYAIPETSFDEMYDLILSFPSAPPYPEPFITAMGPFAVEVGYADILAYGTAYFSTGGTYGASFYLFAWTETGDAQIISRMDAAQMMGLDRAGSAYFLDLNSVDDELVELVKWSLADGKEVLAASVPITLLEYGVIFASSDGAVVAGTTDDSDSWVWDTNNGFSVFTPPESATGMQIFDMSEDGTTLVGYYSGAALRKAFVWTRAGGFQALPTLGGSNDASSGNVAAKCSQDGSIVFGVTRNGSAQRRGFKWTAGGGTVDLDSGEVYTTIAITSCSDDGSVCYGVIDSTKAFKWTDAGGIEIIFTATGGSAEIHTTIYWFTRPTGVFCSDDGSEAFFSTYTGGEYKSYRYDSGGLTLIPNNKYVPSSGYKATIMTAAAYDGSSLAGKFNDSGVIPSEYTGWVYGGQTVVDALRPIATLDDRFFDFTQSVL